MRSVAIRALTYFTSCDAAPLSASALRPVLRHILTLEMNIYHQADDGSVSNGESLCLSCMTSPTFFAISHSGPGMGNTIPVLETRIFKLSTRKLYHTDFGMYYSC